MRFKRKKDLKEQIRELQSIIHIQGSPPSAPTWLDPGVFLTGGEGGVQFLAGLLQVILLGCCLWEDLREGPGAAALFPRGPLRVPSTRLSFQNKGGSSARREARRPCARTGT